MKLSVSLPQDDVDFLDAFAELSGAGSRSAVVQQALDMLRSAQLTGAYEEAFQAWPSDDDTLWESTTADGLGRE